MLEPRAPLTKVGEFPAAPEPWPDMRPARTAPAPTPRTEPHPTEFVTADVKIQMDNARRSRTKIWKLSMQISTALLPLLELLPGRGRDISAVRPVSLGAHGESFRESPLIAVERVPSGSAKAHCLILANASTAATEWSPRTILFLLRSNSGEPGAAFQAQSVSDPSASSTAIARPGRAPRKPWCRISSRERQAVSRA